MFKYEKLTSSSALSSLPSVLHKGSPVPRASWNFHSPSPAPWALRVHLSVHCFLIATPKQEFLWPPIPSQRWSYWAMRSMMTLAAEPISDLHFYLSLCRGESCLSSFVRTSLTLSPICRPNHSSLLSSASVLIKLRYFSMMMLLFLVEVSG